MPPLNKYQKVVRFLLFVGGAFVVLSFLWGFSLAVSCFSFSTLCPHLEQAVLAALAPLVPLAFAVWLYSRRKNYHLALLFLVLSLILVWYGGKIGSRINNLEMVGSLPRVDSVNESKREDVSFTNTGFVVYAPTFLPEGFERADFTLNYNIFPYGSSDTVTQDILWNGSKRVKVSNGKSGSAVSAQFDRCTTGEDTCVIFGETNTNEAIYKTVLDNTQGTSYYVKKGDTYINFFIKTDEVAAVIEQNIAEIINSLTPINLEE